MTSELWRKYTEWPLVGVAVVFLVAYSIEVIADVPDSRAVPYDVIIWATWGLFLIDYLVNLFLAERRLRWFVHNLHQVAILALPMLRPLRLFRVLQVVKLSNRVAGRALRGRLLTYAFAAAVILSYVAALAVLDAEQNVRGSNIRNIGDALWWAVETISTVGYGDYYPVTLIGRLVGVGLMIGGIAVVGIVAGSLAAWLIEQVGNRVVEVAEEVAVEVAVETAVEGAVEGEQAEGETRSEVAVLTEQVARLTSLIESRMPVEPEAPVNAAR